MLKIDVRSGKEKMNYENQKSIDFRLGVWCPHREVFYDTPS